MNAKRLIAATILALSACGSLDRTEKIACTAADDCLVGVCTSGVCVPQETAPNNSIGGLQDSPGLSPQDTARPNGEELPGAREAILESIDAPCSVDSECADGLTCIDDHCVCCEFIIENTNGSGFTCQDQVSPSKLDVCVPTVATLEADPLLDLGKSCGPANECGGNLLCATEATCTNGTLRGCEGDYTYESMCECCVRILSSEELFPGAFDCSPDPQFYRDNCE